MLNSLWRIVRFLIVPLLSLAATSLIPISSPILWLIWVLSFISVCEGGTSTAAMIRPATWLGTHLLLVFFLQYFIFTHN